MYDEVFNIDCIKEYCLNADDIWLKIMQVKKGTPVVLAKNFVKLIEVDGTQEIALCKVNVDQRVNDVQLNNLLSLYNKNSEFEKLIFPKPALSLAVLPKEKGDEEKISSGLSKLRNEDPSYNFYNNTIINRNFTRRIISL